jgi:hypothetical protein
MYLLLLEILYSNETWYLNLRKDIDWGDDHSGRAVYGVNCFRPLERWDRGF